MKYLQDLFSLQLGLVPFGPCTHFVRPTLPLAPTGLFPLSVSLVCDHTVFVSSGCLISL